MAVLCHLHALVCFAVILLWFEESTSLSAQESSLVMSALLLAQQVTLPLEELLHNQFHLSADLIVIIRVRFQHVNPPCALLIALLGLPTWLTLSVKERKLEIAVSCLAILDTLHQLNCFQVSTQLST